MILDIVISDKSVYAHAHLFRDIRTY
jgi:hypothetical protein